MPLIFFSPKLTYPAVPLIFSRFLTNTLLCPFFRLPCCVIILLFTYPAVPLFYIRLLCYYPSLHLPCCVLIFYFRLLCHYPSLHLPCCVLIFAYPAVRSFSLRLPCCALIFNYPAVLLFSAHLPCRHATGICIRCMWADKVVYANFEGASAGFWANFEFCPTLLIGCRSDGRFSTHTGLTRSWPHRLS